MIDSKIISMKDGDIMAGSDIVSRFNEIYDSTNKYILAFITSKCGNTADINDIFQETYMELYQLMSKRGADYITAEKALVTKIAKQKLARHYSLAKRLQMFIPISARKKDSDNEEIDLSDAAADSFLAEDSTEDYVVNQILVENARKFIQTKPAEVEKIFYLFYDVGLTIPEIAENLSLSESSVKNKLYRTVKELQNLLEKEV
ncbi:MAG: sigma-70 family RNA polymerase sigma factor [Oscillospiraceae bacterium]|nr:sigma-70 family RNA polymerase sigma factor [Oscillospiraceae bacterium]